MIKFLFERVTGQPWTTTRSMAAEFGPTPATRYPELLAYSDAELVADGPEILARLAARPGRRPCTTVAGDLAVTAGGGGGG